jgi:hypothetical protein
MGHWETGIWTWLGVMLAIMCANNLVTTWRTHRRLAQETARIKLALQIELSELLQVYGDNLRLIANGKGYVISGRSFVSVIRGNLERITMLEESVMGPVIATFSHNERIEALLAAHGQPKAGHAYRLDGDKAPLNEIRRKYQVGRQRVNAALAALEGKPIPEPQAASVPESAPVTQSGEQKPARAA